MAKAVPDPELTLSETLNVMGQLHVVLQTRQDAVVASAYEKLRVAANYVAQHDPDHFTEIENEIHMQRRFDPRRDS